MNCVLNPNSVTKWTPEEVNICRVELSSASAFSDEPHLASRWRVRPERYRVGANLGSSAAAQFSFIDENQYIKDQYTVLAVQIPQRTTSRPMSPPLTMYPHLPPSSPQVQRQQRRSFTFYSSPSPAPKPSWNETPMHPVTSAYHQLPS